MSENNHGDEELMAAGDCVRVKGHGRATIVECCADEASQHCADRCGRFLVRYHEDGSTYWARRKLLRKMHVASKPVVVTRLTIEYRDAMVHNVELSDVCLEIGCHEGFSTNILSNRSAFVVGIDTAPEVVPIARSRFPHLPFHVADGLDAAATRALAPAGTYTRICIDISGKAPVALMCGMIAAQRAAFPEAKLIVKNEELYDALAVLARREQQQEQQQQQAGVEVGEEGDAGPEEPCAAAAAAAAAAAVQPVPTPAAAAAAAAAVSNSARLRELLGPHLDECELFRHQFAPARTRPFRLYGRKAAQQPQQQVKEQQEGAPVQAPQD